MSETRKFIVWIRDDERDEIGRVKNQSTFLKDCVLVKGRVAIWEAEGKVKPFLLVPRTDEQEAFLQTELNKSQGYLNRDNYHYFLPFMPELSKFYGYKWLKEISESEYNTIMRMRTLRQGS
ncbi:hypothetical protein LAG90_15530 [Marinilongibacter aquaticus]|uniref:hypothetical protein n=1 Tax=Marinilongibacter aquaticus TaxID=2975157 RepID=UPI0021BD226E|nr:hypothetical protein [Marinilongibacter aquaticus]UBM58214.1 hypothetical protein LAG90_15530 [Marinilongibacter aquaticus]